MIARISILLLLLIVLPMAYIDQHYIARRMKKRRWLRFLLWLPSVAMLVLTVKFSLETSFVSEERSLLNTYLLLIGVWTVPQAAFALCSALGLAVCRLSKKRNNWGNIVGLVLAFSIIWITVYGVTKGTRRLNVVSYDISFDTLPASFNGYKIVLVSDIHAGTYDVVGKKYLQLAIDSINAQNADAIMFTGDLQNTQPSELYPYIDMLSSLKAKDGVFSVLGNHDYSHYIDADDVVKTANENELQDIHRQMRWHLLMNENISVRRNNDSIVIAGEEYGESSSERCRADIIKTCRGIADSAFVVLLQHDPSAWRKDILPTKRAQLTLSGHTHGGQIALFGLRLSRPFQREDYGLHNDAGSYLCVTGGLGGLLPLRFGIYPEIAVITLRRK